MPFVTSKSFCAVIVFPVSTVIVPGVARVVFFAKVASSLNVRFPDEAVMLELKVKPVPLSRKSTFWKSKDNDSEVTPVSVHFEIGRSFSGENPLNVSF